MGLSKNANHNTECAYTYNMLLMWAVSNPVFVIYNIFGTTIYTHMHTHHPTYSRNQKSLTQAIVASDSDDHFKGGKKKGKKEILTILWWRGHQCSLSNRYELRIVAMLDELSRALCPSKVSPNPPVSSHEINSHKVNSQ